MAAVEETKAAEVADQQVEVSRPGGYQGEYHGGYHRGYHGVYGHRYGRSVSVEVQVADMEERELRQAIYHGHDGVRGGYRGNDRRHYDISVIDDFVGQESHYDPYGKHFGGHHRYNEYPRYGRYRHRLDFH